MYLGEELRPIEKPRTAPTLACLLLCALFTLWAGVYPKSFLNAIQSAMPARSRAGGRPRPLAPERALAAKAAPPAGP